MPSNIAIITPFGAEPRLDYFAEFLIAQGLVRSGHDVRLYTYRIANNPDYAQNDFTYQGVHTIRCRQRFGFAPGLVWSILKFRPRVVMLCHIRSFLNLSAYLAARLIGAKVVFKVIGFLHDPFVVGDRDNPLETILPKIQLTGTIGQLISSAMLHPWSWCWENFVYHYPLYRADRLITITQFEQAWVRTVTGRDSEIVPWGVPLQKEASQHAPVLPPGVTIPSDFLLFIGQVKKRKGWDTMVEALALLRTQGIRKPLVFVTSSDKSEYQEAVDLIAQRGLSDQVTFLFRISNEEKNWLYHRASGLLAPSRYEGFGLTPFEAFTFGVPVFGTDIPVYEDFLRDGENSLISKKGDPVTLAANIKRLDEPGVRERLIAGGHQTAAQYTDTKIYEKFLVAVKGLSPDWK